MAAFSTRTANQAPQATAQKASKSNDKDNDKDNGSKQAQAPATFHPQTQRTTNPHQYNRSQTKSPLD